MTCIAVHGVTQDALIGIHFFRTRLVRGDHLDGLAPQSLALFPLTPPTNHLRAG